MPKSPTCILALLTLWLAVPAFAQDVVLMNGTIIDGSGRPRVRGNVRIRAGKVTDVGMFRAAAGEATIDVNGLIVAPGFIDLHNHSANGLRRDLAARSQTNQGITTIAFGPDGTGAIAIEDFMMPYDEEPPALNILTFVGHGTVRRSVMADDHKRAATPTEILQMEDLVEFAMREGAFGLSSDLQNDPGSYATKDEVIALAKVASRYGGTYLVHLRNESDKILESIREAIEIGRLAKIPVQIAHLRLDAAAAWGNTTQVLAEIDKGRAQGVDIAADVSPYNTVLSPLDALIPDRKVSDSDAVTKGIASVGGPQNVLITTSEKHPEFRLKTLEEIARERNMTAVDLCMELLKDGGATVAVSSIADKDLRAFYRHAWVMVASDGGITIPHPRTGGTFPKVLGQLVREEKVLTLEQAIRKMTSLPSSRLGLKERGILRKGAAADVVVFDPASIRDKSTFQEPFAPPDGMKYVFINGTMVVKDGRPTEEKPGLALR